MRLRSLLFIPGDRPDRFLKATACGADAVIFDLEDSVVPAAKALARDDVAKVLSGARSTTVFVRINPLSSGLVEADLAAVMPGKPDGIVLPKAEGACSIAALETLLSHAERTCAIAPGQTMLLPIVTETPAALFRLGAYGGSRLAALTWRAEDLPSVMGALSVREADGRYTAPFEVVRALALFAAANVPALETIYPQFRGLDGLMAYASAMRIEATRASSANRLSRQEIGAKCMTNTIASQYRIHLFD